MVEMTWDSNLEAVAQNYQDSGASSNRNPDRTSHYQQLGGSGYVGENWFSGTPDSTMTGGAVGAWTNFEWPEAWGMNGCSEQQNYWAAYESSSANGQAYAHCDGGTVGHYTQVMWASSVRVGCGYSTSKGTLCNYSPGGNYGGYSNVYVK